MRGSPNEAFWMESTSEGGANPCSVPSHNGGDLAAAACRPSPRHSVPDVAHAGRVYDSTSKPVGIGTSSGKKQAIKKKKGRKRILTGSEDQPKVGVNCDKVSFIEPRWWGKAAKITAELGALNHLHFGVTPKRPVATGQSTIQKPSSHLNSWDFLSVYYRDVPFPTCSAMIFSTHRLSLNCLHPLLQIRISCIASLPNTASGTCTGEPLWNPVHPRLQDASRPGHVPVFCASSFRHNMPRPARP